MKGALCVILCLAVAFSLSGVCLAADDETQTADTAQSITLTEEEKDFIKEHPVIRLGVDPEFIPYEFIDEDGEYKGIAADYISLICKKTGLQMIPEPNLIWTQAYEKAVERDLDVLPCISRTAAREKYFLFSDPYYSFQRVIILNEKNTTIHSFDDLYNKTVAVQVNSSHHSYLKAFDTIHLSTYKTVDEALQAVSNGSEIAFVGNLATSNYLMKSLGITNLKYITINNEAPQTLAFAVRQDWPELVGIINKALKSITEEEKITIRNKWIGSEASVDNSAFIRTMTVIGAVIGIVLIVSFFWIIRLKKEIVRRKKTQEQYLAAKEEAERANQIKSMFLARMSHEIRTPLNAITGMAYLIKKTGVSTTQAIYLTKLTQAARNMLSIINDILDFSKIEAGKIEIESISFELDRVLQRVINIASAMVEEKGIEFSMDKSPYMPSTFVGDPAKTEQILVNLVSNAVKFTDRGSVSLSVQAGTQTGDMYTVEFRVKDSGIGMEPQQVERLFVPFDQGDSSINRRFGGTGLGLSIVKSLLDMMGGTIEVKSAPKEGSEFIIALPLKVHELQTDTPKSVIECFKNLYALVIDNNEGSSAALKSCFESFGIAADLAASEDEALLMIEKAHKEKQYNLLIVDYLTPKNRGIEFCKWIKQHPAFNEKTKTILLIPLGSEELYDEIEPAGISFGITKPIIPSVLYNGIIETCGINTKKESENINEERMMVSHPYTILLVEDNQTNQFIAGTILEQAGFEVLKANNGEEGYRVFTDHQTNLDLILMDIHMPVMDGYASADMIRKIDKTIPIVAMTADAIAGVEEKCRNHGIYHYVSKPFEPEQFVGTILKVLGNGTNKPEQVLKAQDEQQDNLEPILNMADGIRRIGGDAKLFLMILKQYYDENTSFLDELKAKIDDKAYEDAAGLVHKIKSSSGNIGAKCFYEAASMLQQALKENKEADIRHLYEKLKPMMISLMAEINAAIND